MRNLLNKIAITTVLLAGSAEYASSQTQINILTFKNTAEMQAYFKHTDRAAFVVSGHRGGTTAGYPENCIPTFENTLKHTSAFFEIDPRLTKDSVIVLMHDATLDRTTTGTGKVSDYTFVELQRFRLKDPQGNSTNYKIPTLKDVVLWSKGKTIVNLDHKDVPLEMTAKLLKACKNDVIMLTVHNAMQAKFYYDQNPGYMMSAFVRNKKEFDDYDQSGVPWKNFIAYVGPTNKPENKVLFDLLHARGVMCMISAAPSYDKLTDAKERAQHYRETFEQGADILESDLPIEVAEAIKPIMPKTTPQQRYWSKLRLTKK
jgi:glycerophosphoryl diester phosphodiesterase